MCVCKWFLVLGNLKKGVGLILVYKIEKNGVLLGNKSYFLSSFNLRERLFYLNFVVVVKVTEQQLHSKINFYIHTLTMTLINFMLQSHS